MCGEGGGRANTCHQAAPLERAPCVTLSSLESSALCLCQVLPQVLVLGCQMPPSCVYRGKLENSGREAPLQAGAADGGRPLCKPRVLGFP